MLRGNTPNPGWTTRLGDMGRVLGITAVSVGRILELLGYRSNKHVTDSAVEARDLEQTWERDRQRLARLGVTCSWCSHLGSTRLIPGGSATGTHLSCAFLVHRVMETMERKPEAIGNAQLVIDLAQAVLDDLLRGPQLVGDLLVALALRDAGDDRQLFG
jgi:hypothetical protein